MGNIKLKSTEVYVAALLCLFAAVIDTIIAAYEGWPLYFFFVVWIQMGIIIVTAIDDRVSKKVQAYLFSTFTANTVFISGLYLKNYYVVFMMLCGTLMLAAFYHDRLQIGYQVILAIISISVHCNLCNVLDLSASDGIAEFGMALFLLLGIGGALYINIVREDKAHEILSETARRAEQAERSKSDFLANMSHEIRTPMNAIIGMCELALRDNEISDNVRDCCGQIQNSGRSLLSIINDILDFSKIESGKMELVEEEFNISSTLNDVVNMTMNRMGDKNLEFIVRVDTSIPKGLIGDEMRIRQIMVNLLTNAVKYTPHGVITLTVSKIVREYGINLNISVKDTGIGIQKENLEKLFNSFQQVDTKKNRAVEGTGLGLVITKRLISSMGGFINVKSEYGKGSEFHCVIPLKVKNRVPFIQIDNSNEINVACYIDVRKFDDPDLRHSYIKFLAEIGQSMQIKNFMCKKFEDLSLRIERGNITHCFIGKEEYLQNKAYFESIADDIEVVIVQNRRDGVVVPKNMRCIYKPIYELPIANIFNHKGMASDQPGQKSDENTFIAPKAKVLLVDDNVINLKVAVGLMQPYKMQIQTAESAKTAISMLESKDFDLVFMDHMMPEMDGVEATKLLRSKEDEYYRQVPIIALTANAIAGAREMFLENGFNGYLAKPIELSALNRVLKQHLPQEYILKAGESQKNEKQDENNIVTAEPISKLIDSKTGFFYVGGNKDAYLSILDTYVKKGYDKKEVLASLFEKKEWKNYVIEVHALKSSSLTIGAKELSERAKNLELSGKAGDYDFIMVNHGAMLELYGSVLKAGTELLRLNRGEQEKTEVADEKPEKTELTREELRNLLERVKESCDTFDNDAVIAVAKEGLGAGMDGHLFQNDFEAIISAADDFDYDMIQQKVREIIEEFGLEE